MIKKIYIIWLILAGGGLCSADLFAQQPNNWIDFNYIKKLNAWLTCENAAGLDQLTVKKTSYIEAFLNKGDGDFINYYQSNNSYSFGGLTESFYRFKNIVFYGKVDYSSFTGKNMGGSSLLDPYFSPFDIVEYADSTAGDKKMETYHLIGAMSFPICRKILLGVKADYKTVSYYKTKDLRHTNDLMDINVTAGIRYQYKNIVDIGFNYYFRRRVEGIAYQSEGNTDQQFNSLVSYGSFMGEQESYSSNGEGFSRGTSQKPIVDYIHGPTVQLDLFPKSTIHFFNEFSLKWRDGYFGKKSSVNIRYTDHEADILKYRGEILYKKANALHQLAIFIKQENLTNYKNSYKSETETSSGNTTIKYYGKTEVLDRTLIESSILYTGNLKIDNNNPIWVLKTGCSFWSREQVASVYPIYRKQDINQILVKASVKRNIIHDDNMFSITFGGIYGFGNGTAKKDGYYSSGDPDYATLDRYLYREYEYLTTSRIAGNIGFRYTKAFPQNYRLYGDVKYSYTKAFDVSSVGDYATRLRVSVGYIF